MLGRLLTIDRRIIFILIGIAVILPALTKIKFPVTKVSTSTQMLYDKIEELPPASVVMISLDYGPSSMAELQPQLVALLHHCFARDLRVIGIAPIIFEAVPLGRAELETIGNKHNKEYGVDYCYLGYRPGSLAVLLGLGKDIGEIYKTDVYRTPLVDIPLMQQVKNYDDVELLITLASIASPPAWVAYVHSGFNQVLAAGVTGVMVSELYPYLDAGQLVGMLPGLKGAAEYEKLIKSAGYTTESGQGAPGMSIQSVVHIVLILLIIFCNVAYFINQRSEN